VAQLRDIKDRIDSVQKTRKMTQAMKMVAAAKFKRASDKALKSRPYLKYLKKTFGMIQSQVSDVTSELLEPNDSQVEVVLLITSDRGLCGGFNANIIRKVDSFLKKQVKPVKLIIFGNKGYQYFKSSGTDIIEHHEGIDANLGIDRIRDIFSSVVSQYVAGDFGKVWLFYNEFQSALATNLIQQQLLPFSYDGAEDNAPVDYIFEPSAEELFGTLAQECVELSLFSAFLESIAAEQGARMAAMDAATENAGDMIHSLKLVYNRQRQAQITTELSEIVAGAEALTA
jgi:F-type H+-transporting ATPase subunit gamma